MEWKTRRIDAILEQALTEDKATSDLTTAVTIDPGLRATATIIAKEECVLCGVGCIPRFLEIFARLDGRSSGRYEVVSHPEIFDGVRLRKGQAVAVIRHNARVILACELVLGPYRILAAAGFLLQIIIGKREMPLKDCAEQIDAAPVAVCARDRLHSFVPLEKSRNPGKVAGLC